MAGEINLNPSCEMPSKEQSIKTAISMKEDNRFVHTCFNAEEMELMSRMGIDRSRLSLMDDSKAEWIKCNWPIEDRIKFYTEQLLSTDPDKADHAKEQLIKLGVLH